MALTRTEMVKRVSQELKDGFYVNLGIGIPTLSSNFVPPGVNIVRLGCAENIPSPPDRQYFFSSNSERFRLSLRYLLEARVRQLRFWL